MGMFDALIPQTPETEFANESYEEIVDGYCAALEDVEAEISGLESLSDAIDNADAFAAAIESCGGSVSPALMQFGYAVDPAFGQLIGRECPSDFATENMEEFGSFALESIQSKLKLAWEAVKNFIIRLWEKLKEFARWVIGLFDRKEKRLQAIIKNAKDKEVKGKGTAFAEKASKKHLRCYTKADIEKYLGSADILGVGKRVVEGVVNAVKAMANKEKPDFSGIADAVKSAGAKFFQANTKTGAVLLSAELNNAFKERTLAEAGFKSLNDVSSAADACLKAIQNRRVLDAMVSDFGKLVKMANDYAKDIKAVNEDINGKDADDREREDIIRDDTKKRYAIIALRKGSIACSKVNVLCGKIINNCSASVIAVAKEAGL